MAFLLKPKAQDMLYTYASIKIIYMISVMRGKILFVYILHHHNLFLYCKYKCIEKVKQENLSIRMCLKVILEPLCIISI